MRRKLRRGMTLIEIMAALALSGMVIIAAAMLLDQANDAVARIGESGARDNRTAIGARVLRELLYDAQSPRDSTDVFSGDERQAAFTTRCASPGGWSASCRVTLALDSTRDSTIVRVDAIGATGLSLRAFGGSAALRYVDPFAANRWTSEWRARATLPAALAILNALDTIVFPVGGVRD